MITVIDYGMGNIGSILNMLKKLGHEAKSSSDVNEISQATKLILPGVGAFDNGMQQLKEKNLIDVLNKKVCEEKIPILGICLGIQLFCNGSQEGKLAGLGWIDADVIRFRTENTEEKIRIPHMGWNSVTEKKHSVLFEGMFEHPRFYFVHSYHLKLKNENDAWLKTHYGYDFVSAIEHENIFGCQFHPEKSHKYGMVIYKNFAEKI